MASSLFVGENEDVEMIDNKPLAQLPCKNDSALMNIGNGTDMAGDESTTDLSTMLERFPPEIRIKIYKLVLVADGPIKVSCYEDKSATAAKLAAVMSTGMVSAGRKGAWKVWNLRAEITLSQRIGGRRKFSFGELHGVSLLLVNKQSKEEAGYILYGENPFIFDNTRAFMIFTNRIGGFREMLTNVNIKYFNLGGNHRDYPVRPLSQARGLRKLEITVKGVDKNKLSTAARKLFYQVIHPSLFPCQVCRTCSFLTCMCTIPEERKILLKKFDIRFCKGTKINLEDGKGRQEFDKAVHSEKLMDAILKAWK